MAFWIFSPTKIELKNTRCFRGNWHCFKRRVKKQIFKYPSKLRNKTLQTRRGPNLILKDMKYNPVYVEIVALIEQFIFKIRRRSVRGLTWRTAYIIIYYLPCQGDHLLCIPFWLVYSKCQISTWLEYQSNTAVADPDLCMAGSVAEVSIPLVSCTDRFKKFAVQQNV